ncbi:MAG: ComEC family competence protein [Alphaproteobacteria bacterium]|nr:ComEC family competence protein [Alphaproteobacteria bacterium]
MLLGAGDFETQPPSADAYRQPVRRSSAQRIADGLEEERARWFYWVPVFVGCGALLYFSLPVEPRGFVVAGVLAAALGVRFGVGAGTYTEIVASTLVCLAIGMAAAKVRTEIVRAPVLSGDIGPVEATGFVELIEAREGGGVRLTVRVGQIESIGPDDLPARMRVSVRPAVEGLLPGDRITMKVKLSPPPRPSVPGGYDFARYAFFRGIGAVGYATAPPVKTEVAAGHSGEAGFVADFALGVARLRKDIGDRVKAALPGQTGAIANALITGDRSGIAEDTNEAYRASGLYHILSISGLHMAIMGGAVFIALRFMLALVPSIALNYPIKKWAAAGAILGSFGYLMISGGSFATVRSFLMIAVMFASILADRPAIAMRNVALSALLILLLFPESVVDPGFQMSFAAVVALVSVYEALARRAEPWLDGPQSWLWRAAAFFAAIVGSTLVASAAVAPLGVYHFHQTQHFAVLANLIAVPICNLIVMPAALGALVLMPFGGEALALAVMGPGLEAMGVVAAWVAGLKGAVSHVPAIPAHALVAMAAGGLWLCLIRPRWRLLGIVAIAAGLAMTPLRSAPDLLVGDEGRLVVLRDAAGAFAGLTSRYSEYELAQWLSRDGDKREAKEVGLGGAMSCDEAGCTGYAKGLRVAIARHPSALRDDCRRADILVTGRGVAVPGVSATEAKPADAAAGMEAAKLQCPRPKLIITRAALQRFGTHSVSIADDGAIAVETVAEVQGVRPWSRIAPGK